MRTAEIPILLKKRPVSAGGIVLFDELWPGGSGASPPAGWTIVSGTPTQDGAGHLKFASVGQVLRNVGVSSYTITVKVRPDNQYPAVIFHSDSSSTTFAMLQIRGDTSLLKYQETNDGGSTGSNVHDGTTVMDLTTSSVEHTIDIIVSGTSVLVKLDGANEITGITASLGLGNTYLGFAWQLSGTAIVAYLGEIKAIT